MSDRAKRAGRGFTLLELLIVISIISLLTAILLPQLAKARQNANRVKCMNNLRQVGVGVLIYSHDYRYFPPVDLALQLAGQEVTMPVYYADARCGLMNLPPESNGFERASLACPEGWASGGNTNWYLPYGGGISKSGAAYMDYAYWAGRFPPKPTFDVRHASFAYRVQDQTMKILASDVVPDAVSTASLGSLMGGGNHTGRLSVVQMTDGQEHRLSTFNQIHSRGASVLFTDQHVDWIEVGRLTQQVNGMCYPPCDQWGF